MSVTHATPKADPESLALRARPRPVTRLNRRVLVIGAGVGAAAVLGATIWSLQAPKRRGGEPQSELYNVDRVSRADAFDQLPKNYSEVSKPETAPAHETPVLGEPLPGDWGGPMLRARRNTGLDVGGYGGPTIDGQVGTETDVESAAKSALFFRSSRQDAATERNSASPVAQELHDQPFDAMATASASSQAIDPTAAQNRQEQKQAFMDRRESDIPRNSDRLQLPASPYQVMAGTVIPAALVTGINSDLPGQVIANVTESVYDTATGQHLLIPQGSRLIGRYDSQVAFGQRRVLLVWTRLILPDASSIPLDKLPGVDPAGYAGLEDGVDWHWDRILAGAALSTLLGVGAELAAPDRGGSDGRVIVATRDSAQETISEVGQEITRRNLSVQPTLTIRPGFPMRVMVSKDLVLRPYQPLLFDRSAP
ncbi:MAG: conjugal transfer protein TrbI [Hydrocarboniphaga sp.]|uniref:TrbI/VirB10 family protein n=1 Tax=Hydrocarboniphaga sp. TaxID=2033016 RepID=UPI00260A8361|nr:TrbI/VirB10 family protein [Hydrocarboniphaga sp.]MDB5971182.1 conjugal transfer protein TrbI [Hydrocarboniphaga sp.]